ncbi:hypothetical protein Tco_0554181 [Tanacetum coccineum]
MEGYSIPPTTAMNHIAIQRESRQENYFALSILDDLISGVRVCDQRDCTKGMTGCQKILSQLNQLKAKPDDEDIRSHPHSNLTNVPTGKDNFIVSTGRPNMVPAGRTIVSPGSIIVGLVKARFGGNAESKKMKKSMLKQEFSEFRISEG